MIARFYDATSGRVLVDGVDVKDYPFHQLRGKIGMVPQKAVLFQGTIAENLRWGKRDATEAEMYRALETAQARDFVEAKEKGLQTEVQQGGKNFSGGQKQRLTIARAVIRNPEILILDDSASALDYATDARLRKAIRRMDPDITVFLVSQRAATIQYADQIIVLDDGEMAGTGHPSGTAGALRGLPGNLLFAVPEGGMSVHRQYDRAGTGSGFEKKGTPF